jgi:hypothetical protein
MNSTAQTLCLQCKKFFGSEITKGFCSVCFKLEGGKLDIQLNTEKKEESRPTQMEEKKEERPVDSQNTKPVQTAKDQCWKCQKRVGYLGFTCRCKYVFCGAHRHFTEHNCDFDYKGMERERLAKENPLVAAKKV